MKEGVIGRTLDLVSALHKSSKRDYLGRMLDEKVECMKVARRYGMDFWDGARKYGYGGYRYDGRWADVAKQLIEVYQLPQTAKILDVGCGKGFLLHEIKRLLPASQVSGFDVSEYAIENSKEEIRPRLFVHRAQDPFPFADQEFDLAVSLTTLHNLPLFELETALRQIERVAAKKYIVVESYRNHQEQFNLQCWALTCESFFKPQEWTWLFRQFGYTGDYEFIYFE